MEHFKDEFVWYIPGTGKSVVSIATYGITVGMSALKEMESPDYVKFGYNEKTNGICIAVCDKENPCSIKVKYNTTTYVRFSLKSFISKINLIKGNNFNNKAIKYDAVYNKNEKALYINLNCK